MQLTASQIRYLLTILQLSQSRAATSSSDIATELKVSRPSVNKMLGVLSAKGLLEKRHYGAIHLTDSGMQLATDYIGRVNKISDKLICCFDLPQNDIIKCAVLLLSKVPNLMK